MFLKMYLFRAGFLDGLQGFLLAVFSAHYVFVKYAKLWERKKGTDSLPP
jgi:(heptosyl)LPS beta-1,4-glucosyltransferase